MEWNIKSRSEACTATGRPFVEGETFYTLLLSEKAGLVRQDLCEEAWENRNDNIRPLSFWQSIFKPRPTAPPEAVGREDAESELRSLLESGNSANDKTCLLLALLLERKRILRARERTVIEGRKIIFYEHTDTQETFAIPDMDFNLAEVANLQHELSNASRIFAKTESAVSSDVVVAPPT